jgi:phage-related protein
MIIRTFKLIGANTDEIILSTEDTTDYLLGQDVSGLALPPINVNISEGAGDGGRFQSSRRLPREIDLPIWVFGTDRVDVEDKLRTLAKLISDRNGSPTKIQAIFEDTISETIETFTVEGYYTGGFDINYGSNTGKDYAYVALTFKCPQPYWVNETETSLLVLGSELPEALAINNTGDIETFPTFVIEGPTTTITFSNTNGTLSYTAAIAGGSTITINTENATVVNQLGQNRYQNLGSLPKMFTLPEGNSTLNITGTVDPTAEITVRWKTRREIVF